MEVDKDVIEALNRTLDSLQQIQNQLSSMNKGDGHVGTAIIQVQAGGIMAMALMFASAIALGIAVATSFNVSARMTKIEKTQDDQQQYLSAIYMMAPQLKPKEQDHAHP